MLQWWPDPLWAKTGRVHSHSASLHVAFELCAGDVGSRTVLLRFEGAILNPVVNLGAAHAQNLCRLGDFEAQGGQGGGDVFGWRLTRFTSRHDSLPYCPVDLGIRRAP